MLWTQLLKSALFRSATPHSRRRALQNDSRPATETLEERLLLSGMTFRVTNTRDDGEPGSLRFAIEEANKNKGEDQIHFARSAHGEIELSSPLTITDDLIIDGRGARRLTISGEGMTRVFAVVPPDLAEPIDVTIRDLTIANGLATDAPGFPPITGFAFGGGIYNLGSHLTVSHVRMLDNQAGVGMGTSLGAGGAIANEFGGRLTVVGSTFTRNTAIAQVLGVGGAITSDIGPTLDDEGNPGEGTPAASVSIRHSTFRHNTAEALVTDPANAGDLAPFAGFALGGAFLSVAGEASVSHSTFLHNTAKSADGIRGNAGGTAVGGAIFSNDFSPFDAVGPIFGRDSRLDVEHSLFIGNAAVGGDGEGGGKGGAANGGAIGASIAFFPEGGAIRHSVFQGNAALGGEGGAAGGEGGDGTGGAVAILAGSSLEIGHAKFTGNLARGGNGGPGAAGGDGQGGGVGLTNLVTSIQVDGANLFDGLLPSVTIHHSRFLGNQAQGGRGSSSGGTGGNGIGGGLAVDGGGQASVSRSSFLFNRTQGGRGETGGNGQGGGVGVTENNAELEIARTFLVGNQAVGGNGADADGLGQGGAGFNGGDPEDLALDAFTLFWSRFNSASDEADGIFGPFTLS